MIVRGPVGLADRARDPTRALAAVTGAIEPAKPSGTASAARLDPAAMEQSALPNG